MGRGIGEVLDRRYSTLIQPFTLDRAECLVSQMFNTRNVIPTLQCAVERRAFLVGAKPTQQLSLRLVAARAVHGGNDMD